MMVTDKTTVHTLPSFLGLGAQRSGSSWLWILLKSHPEIFVPKNIKEVHYFDVYYDRGLDWYQAFFPMKNGNAQLKAVGEITPEYLFREPIPERVRENLPEAKFIVLLRNPVERAYSHFKMAYYEGLINAKNFSDFIENDPTAFARGLYATQLKRWFEYFPQNRFLILIFEEVMKNPSQAALSIASFLEVSSSGFSANALSEKVNASHAHRNRKLYHFGIQLRNYLRKKDYHWTTFIIQRVGSKYFKFLGESKKKAPPLEDAVRSKLIGAYNKEITDLESLLNRDLSFWRS